MYVALQADLQSTYTPASEIVKNKGLAYWWWLWQDSSNAYTNAIQSEAISSDFPPRRRTGRGLKGNYAQIKTFVRASA